MNCKTCGYRLWNIASRACPECGVAFAPSDFEFAPNEVQYVCPGCEQVYYGTSPTGHLVPPEFDCVKCGRHLVMDEMILRPADWSREDYTGASMNPWLERAKRGRFKAFFAMIGWGMARPAELMRATPPDSSLNQAWWYAIVSCLIYSLVGYTPIAILFAIMAASFSPTGGGGNIAGAVTAMVTPLASLGVGVLVWCALLGLWGVVTQVCLAGSGAASTMRRTFQALCYTCGPMCLLGIPCLGVYMLWPIGIIWWMISGVLAVKEAQQVGAGRAVFAVFAWPTIVLGGFVALIVWFVMSMTTAMSSMQSGVGVWSLGFAIQQHAMADPNGQGPTHALQLTQGQTFLSTDTFIDWNTNSTLAGVPVASVDLDQFDNAAQQQKQAYLQQALANQPPNVVAHRLGDFVFTYHGIDLKNNPDPGLWVMIFSPDPDQNQPPDPTDYCKVIRADTTDDSFQFSQLSLELAQQNTLRQALGLPPLPDPQTVTHAQPATVPSAPY